MCVCVRGGGDGVHISARYDRDARLRESKMVT